MSKANEALDKMAENARELGLDYEPALCAPAADGVCESLDCPNHKPAQQEPVRVPVTDNTYNYAKSLAEAIFKQHFASDEHYSSGRIVWGVNDTVIGILTQIDNMVADMVRKPAQQEPVAWRNAALRVGEDLCSVGPFGYYDMTAEQWLDWALSVVTVHAPPQAQPAQQEPVFSFQMELHAPAGALIHPYPHVVGTPDFKSLFGKVGDRVTFYTSPPAQRTWVGLTHDEYDAICDKHSTMSDFDFLEDIEAKIKEKNNG